MLHWSRGGLQREGQLYEGHGALSAVDWGPALSPQHLQPTVSSWGAWSKTEIIKFMYLIIISKDFRMCVEATNFLESQTYILVSIKSF